MSNESPTIDSNRLADILARGRRLADAREFEAIEELLEDFMPSAEAAGPDDAVAQLRGQLLVLRARSRQVLGQWPGAEEDLRGVLALATRLQERTALVEALLIMGDLQRDRGEVQDSLETCLHAARVAEGIDDRLGAAESDLALAAIYARLGDAKEGETRVQRAMKAIEGVDSPRARRLRCAALVQQAVEALRRGNQDQTVILCRQALAAIPEDPLALEMAEAHRFMGVVASMRLQHKEALGHLVDALEIYKKSFFKFGQAKIYNSIGQSLLAMSRNDEAVHFMEKAETICSELGAIAEAATLYGKLGQVYLQNEEYDKAISYFQKDLQISRKLSGRRARAYIHCNLGLALGQSGEMAEAVSHFKESLQLFQQVGDEVNTGKIYMELTTLYIRQKNYERARGMAQWATNIFTKLKQSFELAWMNTLTGMILRGEKRYAEAEQQFRDATEFFKFREMSGRLAESLYEYGMLLVDMGKRDRGMERLVEALEAARELGLKQLAGRCFAAVERLDEAALIRTFVN